MYIQYEISKEAINDYIECCPSSTAKSIKQNKNDTSDDIKYKINRCANLGMLVDTFKGIEVIKYFNLLLMVKEGRVIYIYRDDNIEPYFVSEKAKNKYDTEVGRD
jgi:hypothetical protein